MKLEICVDSYESVLNAKNAGADRLELCSALDLDGLTPTAGLVDIAVALADIELFVMLRPRGGNFVYDELEFEQIKQDILTLKEKDIDGFVFGALKSDGSLDLDMIREVVDLAYPRKVSLHRAFDYSLAGENQIDELIQMGVCRILTSGKKEAAIEGIDLLRRLESDFGDRIEIMAGSGVRPNSIEQIYDETGIRNFHMSARTIKNTGDNYTPDFGYGDMDIKVANFDMVKKAVDLIGNLGE